MTKKEIIDMLLTIRDEVKRKLSDDPPTKMEMDENIERRLCVLFKEVGNHHGNGFAADCFCGDNPPRRYNERAIIEERIIAFVEDAVRQAITNQKLTREAAQPMVSSFPFCKCRFGEDCPKCR